MACSNSFQLLLCSYLSFIQLTNYMHQSVAWGSVDPTKGFISLPLNQSDYHFMKPYNVPLDKRYSFVDGVHKLWVFSKDKPHSRTSRTKPRTEIAIQGYSYTSGVWQFEGYGFVPNGTSGVCIMQVFGASPPYATTLMIQVHNGALKYYTGPTLVPNIYNKWFRLNVIHDVDAAKLKVFINGHLKYEVHGRGGTYHTMKFGVYAQKYDSSYMESRWKDIKVLRKI